MNIFGYEISKKDKTENQPSDVKDISKQKHSVSISNIDDYIGIFSPYTHLDNFVFMFNNIAEVQFPIKYIVDRIRNANFVLKKWSDDSEIWLDSSKNPKDLLVARKMKAFLSKPNNLQTFKAFVSQAFIFKYLTGNQYLYAATSPSLKDNIWEYCNQYFVLPSQSVKINTDSKIKLFQDVPIEDIIKGYELNTNVGKMKFDPALILHSKDIPSLKVGVDSLYGQSRLLSQKYPISNICAVYEARNVIYTKRGALGMLINKKRDVDSSIPMTDSEKKNLRNDFQNTYGLNQNKDTIIISDIDVLYQQIGMSIQDLQPFEECLIDAAVIAGCYGIDSTLIPRKDHSTFSNVENAEKKVYNSVVIPEVKAFLDELNEWLGLNAAGYYIDAKWDDVAVLQESKLQKEKSNQIISEKCKSQFFSGMISYNEWRVAIGCERIENKLYDKTIIEMTDDEYNLIISRLKGNETANTIKN